MKSILDRLKEISDENNADFQSSLTPGVERKYFLGCRVPDVRKLASELYKDGLYKTFIKELPHKYFDENMLHAAILCEIKDSEECIKLIDAFLDYVDNWAVCDAIIPKCFKKKNKLPMEWIKKWTSSDRVYTCRFGVGCLMRFYLDQDYCTKYPEYVAEIESDEYYINMMNAWYFATALAKQWDTVITFLEEKRLPVWVHNKAIQKSIESFRITDEQKNYLRSLKIK